MTFLNKITSTVNHASEAVDHGAEQAASSAQQGIKQVADAARPAADHIVQSAHQAVDTLAAAVGHAVSSLNASGTRLDESEQRFVESCRAHVRDKPITSLGIAVASGFLLSWALSLR